MKVGGNESATKYFQSHGGSAALNSKDAKVKYTSTAANKYKDELARRCEADAKKYPNEVVIEEGADEAGSAGGSGTQTPASGGDDDFFSSWDKPAVKRPSNPPSRVGTPAQRAGSPFLNAPGANGNGRPKSPLAGTEGTAAAAAAPAAAKPTAAIRKPILSGGAGGAKPKPNILGAKKTKLGAKKLDASALDFDAAEKKAREEAERKERLGYDPDEEAPPAAVKAAEAPSPVASNILAPTPVSPGAGARGRSDSEMERLGMGVRRLGFGQIGGGGGAAAAAPKKMGFGAVGAKKPVEGESFRDLFLLPRTSANPTPVSDDSEQYARTKFGAQKGISSDEFFGRNAYDANAQSEAKSRLENFSGASAISSNAYFGRPEDDEDGGADGDYGDLETAAKDFVRKFGITAGDDLENLGNLVGEVSGKFGDAVRAYLNS